MAAEVTEICLLWGDWQIQQWWACMTKAEWSGWMQAIGSAAAIMASVLLVRFQMQAAQRQLKRQALSRLRAFIHLCNLLFSAVTDYKSPELLEVRLWRVSFDELLHDARVLPIEHLTVGRLMAFQAQRSLLAQTIEILRYVESTTQKTETGEDAPIKDPEALIERMRLLHADFAFQGRQWKP